MTRIDTHQFLKRAATAALIAGAVSTVSFAEPLGFAGPLFVPSAAVQQVLPDSGVPAEAQDVHRWRLQ